MELQEKSFCYNCFREFPSNLGEPGFEENSAGGPCPYCGFDLEENAKKYPVALRAGTILNQRYIVGRVLGQGGFGITYLAWDTKLSAKVAVKEYMPNEIAARIGTTVSVAMESRAEDFTYGAERFQEEARTLAKFMGQPNIAGVTDYFDENDTSYFVMDYIEGISFKTYIANQGGKVTIEEALDVMIPVLRALTAVHAEGFIHRDVTPDNIYITKDGNVKLLDFGSARYSIGDKSRSLDVILKVGYAPKEQYIRRGRQGPYTDVYSCAACLYAAITGFLPPESLERLDHDTLIPPSEAGVEIPLYLERAILKGLAVQPENRFQTAAEFLEAIESQQVVELPGKEGSSENAEQKTRDTLALEKQNKKRSYLPIFAGGAFLIAAAAFAAGTLTKKENDTIAMAGNTFAESDISSAEKVPEIMIGEESYSADETDLDLRDKNLNNADLLKLSQMTDLVELNLDDNPEITDLSSLSGLTNLKVLRIQHTGVSDLSPIADLTGLTELYLANPEVSDLTAISGLTNLTELWLDDGNTHSSKIVDLSPLSGPINLQRLTLPSAPDYADLSPLSALTELRELRMMGIHDSGANSIDSLEFLKNMTKLEKLSIVVRNVDLSPLQNLTNLQQLSLAADKTHAEDLTLFSGMTSLEELVIRGDSMCSASDMTALSGLTKLRKLILSVSGLRSLSGLENMSELEDFELYLTDSTLTDLAPLANLSELRNFCISVGGNPPGPLDISALAGLSNLQTVEISPDRVANKDAVSHVPNVKID